MLYHLSSAESLDMLRLIPFKLTAACLWTIIPGKGHLPGTKSEICSFARQKLAVVINYQCIHVFLWQDVFSFDHQLVSLQDISWYHDETQSPLVLMFSDFMFFVTHSTVPIPASIVGSLWAFQITTLGRKIQRSATVTKIVTSAHVIQRRRKIQATMAWRRDFLFSIQGGALINAQPDLQALLAQLVSWNLVGPWTRWAGKHQDVPRLNATIDKKLMVIEEVLLLIPHSSLSLTMLFSYNRNSWQKLLVWMHWMNQCFFKINDGGMCIWGTSRCLVHVFRSPIFVSPF